MIFLLLYQPPLFYDTLFMAAITSSRAAEIFQGNNNSNEVSRHEVQAAIAKAVELRALHAALLQGNTPPNIKFPSNSPVSQHQLTHFSAQNYPVFTPVSFSLLLGKFL